MELKIGVQELGRALARSQGIVEKKSTMPILSHVLIEAKKGDQLHVSATDLDVSISGEQSLTLAAAPEGGTVAQIVIPFRTRAELRTTLVASGEGR